MLPNPDKFLAPSPLLDAFPHTTRVGVGLELNTLNGRLAGGCGAVGRERKWGDTNPSLLAD